MKKIISLTLTLFFVVACEKASTGPALTPTITLTATPEGTPTLTVTRSLAPAITFIPTKNLTPEPISPEAEAYLNEFLDVFLANTINRNELDPEQVRTDTFAHAAGAQTTTDTYDTIRHILSTYGDPHSFFLEPQDASQRHTATINDFPAPEGLLLEERIGYIYVGEFMTSEPDEMIKYADAVQQILRDLDAQLPCGWIVDLSRGSGGNMWPAIAGLGSLIGEGRIGAFLDPDGGLYYWYYRDGSAGVEDYPPNVTVSDPEFQLSAPAAPVAVLINHTTGSAGEAIAIAFRGRPNTLFFGTPSFGFTTGNSTIPLSDGAAIALTQVTFVDRTGQVYGGAIIPDVETYASMNSRDVLDWLLSQPACSNP